MTNEQMNRGNYLLEQERYIDRLFTAMQEHHCTSNLDNNYRCILAAAYTEVKNQIKKEFAEL